MDNLFSAWVSWMCMGNKWTLKWVITSYRGDLGFCLRTTTIFQKTIFYKINFVILCTVIQRGLTIET